MANWAERQVRKVLEREKPGWDEDDVAWLIEQRESGAMSVEELRELGVRDRENHWATKQVGKVLEREKSGWDEDDVDWLIEQRQSGAMSVEELRELGIRDRENHWATKQVMSVATRERPSWEREDIDWLIEQRQSMSMSVEELQRLGLNQGSRKPAIQREIEALQKQAGWSGTIAAGYVDRVLAGEMTLDQVRDLSVQAIKTRENNLRRADLVANSLGIPPELMSVFTDSYIKFGDSNLALIEMRKSPKYDQYYPGNRREDGTYRYGEQQYTQVVESYASTLEDFGLNPDVYEDFFGSMIEGDVAPDEFYDRVDAINSRLVNQPEDVLRAAADEFGLPDAASPNALLGIALNPEIGNQVLERRISIAQVTGQSKRFGFARSRGRVQDLINAGMDPDQAGQFYSGAVPTVQRLSASSMLSGENPYGISDLEDATVMGDNNALSRSARLSQQESSRYSRAANVQADATGALTGLRRR